MTALDPPSRLILALPTDVGKIAPAATGMPKFAPGVAAHVSLSTHTRPATEATRVTLDPAKIVNCVPAVLPLFAEVGAVV